MPTLLAGKGMAPPCILSKKSSNSTNETRQRRCPTSDGIFLAAQEKGPLTEKAYLEALDKNHRLSQEEGIDAVIKEYQLDAIVAPTSGPAHLIDLVYGDRDTGGSTSPAAVAGYPSITVPAGYVFGLPVGISFFGRAFSEPTLLKLRRSPLNKRPGFADRLAFCPRSLRHDPRALRAKEAIRLLAHFCPSALFSVRIGLPVLPRGRDCARCDPRTPAQSDCPFAAGRCTFSEEKPWSRAATDR